MLFIPKFTFFIVKIHFSNKFPVGHGNERVAVGFFPTWLSLLLHEQGDTHQEQGDPSQKGGDMLEMGDIC